MTGRREVVWSRQIGPKLPSQPTTGASAPIMLAFGMEDILLAGRIRSSVPTTTIIGYGKSSMPERKGR